MAADGGYGTVNLDVDRLQERFRVSRKSSFYSIKTDSPETCYSWLKTMCEQALYYRDNQKLFHTAYTASSSCCNKARCAGTTQRVPCGRAAACWLATIQMRPCG